MPDLIDLTLLVTPKHSMDTERYQFLNDGHLGTHFDVRDKEFPLAYVQRPGIVFDVSRVRDRDIEEADIDLPLVGPDMFVILCTGFIDEEPYGTERYFDAHPQLSDALIDGLLDRGVSLIGVDCAGVRRGKEHTPKDQYCADRGVFVIENLCNLKAVLRGKRSAGFLAHTYPVKWAGMTGLPCRVVAQL